MKSPASLSGKLLAEARALTYDSEDAILKCVAEAFGTPTYVYNLGGITCRSECLRAALADAGWWRFR